MDGTHNISRLAHSSLITTLPTAGLDARSFQRVMREQQNLETGLLSLPKELRTKILQYVQGPGRVFIAVPRFASTQQAQTFRDVTGTSRLLRREMQEVYYSTEYVSVTFDGVRNRDYGLDMDWKLVTDCVIDDLLRCRNVSRDRLTISLKCGRWHIKFLRLKDPANPPDRLISLGVSSRARHEMECAPPAHYRFRGRSYASQDTRRVFVKALIDDLNEQAELGVVELKKFDVCALFLLMRRDEEYEPSREYARARAIAGTRAAALFRDARDDPNYFRGAARDPFSFRDSRQITADCREIRRKRAMHRRYGPLMSIWMGLPSFGQYVFPAGILLRLRSLWQYVVHAGRGWNARR